jgi:hypothetical protein
MEDGEIQIGSRWNTQSAAPAGEGWISICLIGDLDVAQPTRTQMRRLEHLATTLQKRFGIPAQGVRFHDRPYSSAGIGKKFPSAEFTRTLLQ